MYTKELPKLQKIQQLARLSGPFPASARRIAFYAEHFGLGHAIIDFLHLFRPSEIFESRSDFVNRCNRLMILIAQKQELPKETMYSRQGYAG